jgi:hypothetical protein
MDDWTDIERRFAMLEHRVNENNDRLDGLADDLEERTWQVEDLFYVMEEIVEAHRAIVGRVPIVVLAEDVMKGVIGSGFFDQSTREQELEQIDKWIDAVGTAPPVDASVWGDVLEKRPLPNPPAPKPR